jgi:hypothetical protein
VSTSTILPRLASLGKIVKADTIRILKNFMVLVVFDLVPEDGNNGNSYISI